MLERRSFLSGLATLPLIGGSVALIGKPTAAAVHVSEALQLRYLAWLANEHAACAYELCPPRWTHNRLRPEGWHGLRANVPMLWFPEAPDVEAIVTATPASTRAAVVLSAAGVGIP